MNLQTGTRTTLYSNLNPRTLAHEPGTLWGATLLVAGTTVGAGILALPAVTQASGFAATTGTLLGCGAFAMATGLLIAEVNMNVVARYGSDNVTFTTMAEKTLGPTAASGATFLYIFHNYALLVAYVARAGQIVATQSGLPPLAGAAAFAMGFGGLCYGTTQSQFDRINGLLLGMAVAAFVALLTVAGSEVDWPVLGRANWATVPPTIPVMALAFVYHNIVPVIVHNLECDARKQSGGPVVAPLVQAFSFLAIATSFTGFVLAAVDFLPDAFKPLASVPRAGRYALVVLPPILLSTASPGIFFASLDIAGTYGVMTLYGMMPAAMAWASRYNAGAVDVGGDAALAAAGRSTAAVMEVATGSGAATSAGAEAGETASRVVGEAAAVGAARTVELVPGGPAVLLLTGAAAAAVIVSQWVY
ncbi:hypothetical protein GPECTOR_22g900 [Gonium pectorale]|uniref:Amino acid transporter transmembrane domain-containing protein n=1 Tax=Gonium pectorale TaxID=33097 RepID=A0A150GHK2_GONPE|nr:hypothetical protein GPECTOR_22g900 [Gonium pectorale]|eukprot:KXZ49306.1 hypothetical protein GPECTOR_22g900 [Gonium pectorale]